MSDIGVEVLKEVQRKVNCYLGGECLDRGDSKGKGLQIIVRSVIFIVIDMGR